MWFVLLFVFLTLFHLIFIVDPVKTLFVFLFFVLTSAVFLLLFNTPYLCFVLISIYGGAIIVLFLLVFMLLNKK